MCVHIYIFIYSLAIRFYLRHFPRDAESNPGNVHKLPYTPDVAD